VWQPCLATQEALRTNDTQALASITALQRARCSLSSSIQSSDFWYAKTDYVKLRSVSLSYRLPQKYSFTRAGSTTLTLAGRNLFTWTKYDGIDPESSDASDQGNGLGRREYYQLPPYRTFLATVRLTF
jgi:hypothetical protein